MRGVEHLRRGWVAIAAFILAGSLLGGCKSVDGGPDRLYPVADEVARARTLLDVEGPDGIPGLVTRYYAVRGIDTTADTERMYWRNEIIARRMYIIDVQYTEYETALLNERQKFGFGTSLAAQSLAIAASLTTPLRSAQLLGGVAAGVGAARGFYDSEIVIAKTIQIAQGHMRANRDDVAKRILPLRTASSVLYPLSAAMRDLEDYYSAGTLSAGLIDALGQSGTAAQQAAAEKALVMSGIYSPDESTRILDAFLRPGGGTSPVNRTNLKAAQACMPKIAGVSDVREILTSSTLLRYRLEVISCLKIGG
jgi:hypothetical protein